MNPYPLALLNHLTFPCSAISLHSFLAKCGTPAEPERRRSFTSREFTGSWHQRREKSSAGDWGGKRRMVPKTGLEPVRIAPHAPQTCASTNSATWAQRTARILHYRGVPAGAGDGAGFAGTVLAAAAFLAAPDITVPVCPLTSAIDT